MIIQKVKVSEINSAEYNPQVNLKPGDREYEKLKKSIDSFGYVEPVVWNKRTGNLVGGHQRIKILTAQGLKEIDAVVVDFSLEQEKVLNLALNKTGGGWDEEKLAIILDELIKVPDLDIGITGFDQSEISQIFDRYCDPADSEQGEDPEQIENPITKPGDLIELGHHRVLCGDSSKKEDIDRLLGGRKVALLWSDPPYNVQYSGENRPLPDSGHSKEGRNWRKIENDNLSQEEYESWLEKVLKNVSGCLQKGAAVYIWNGHRQFGPMHQILIKQGFHVSCVITWAKERFALGYGDYNQQTEFCLYGWKENNGSHRWYGPKNESTLWEISRDPIQSYQHPTQKAISLAIRAIKNSSQRKDIILDTFLGSGTALIAAEGLQRVCYGMELDPRYCDVIVRRYIALVGKDKVSAEIVNRYLNKEDSNGK